MFEMKIIGVDVGGTFTDIILTCQETGEQYVHKVPSTPESQDLAVTQGIQEILLKYDIRSDDIGLVVHGTTVATNAMLERKGAKVELIATAGLEDVLEIGRQNRQDIYDLRASRAEPLVDREDRIGVNERINSEGGILVALSKDSITDVVRKINQKKPDSIAISLLFSYKNQSHEKALLESLSKSTNSYVVASSNVLPEFREYERTSTTVLEAYLGPLVIGYLQRLDSSLSDVCPKSKLTVMQSNGGTMLASRAHGKAIGLAISGLAGGAIGGWEVSKQSNVQQAITLDMGGTSCDISAVMGRIVVRPDNEVGGLPLRMPSVDVKTIGAGGGSIAWVDRAGVLHVGPHSAGADPGPAAYGKGGTQATVTDANLILGRLNPDFFLGGNVKLDSSLAREAVSETASTLGLSLEETALGIIRISTANMVQAIREVTVERGADPRAFVLVPFGGAGPTQAVDIAEALSINQILIPPHPGITSALGLVCTDLRVDLMRTILLAATERSKEEMLAVLNKLTNDARNRLLDQGAVGEFKIIWKIDMRYAGQSHELTIEISQNSNNIVADSISKFENTHYDYFGYKMDERDVEWVTARAVVEASSGEFKPYIHSVDSSGSLIGTREVLLNSGAVEDAEIYRRWNLAVGQVINGTAIIEQLDTTTFVGPGWSAEQRADGSLLMGREEH
ncbi:MAG: hydantoinase/oxoprolinase family protein [Candidatus Thorarchaeota archaeon]|jgi:N-methylhydantoinase A